MGRTRREVGEFLGDDLGQFGGGRVGEDEGDGDLRADRFLDAPGDLEGRQRVSAGLEEVGVLVEAFVAQCLLVEDG